jgi:hypothetical protein
MSILNFLFNGSWGFMPKPIFWFLLGWIACSINENGTSDGVKWQSWVMGGVGTLLAIYSLWLSLRAEK